MAGKIKSRRHIMVALATICIAAVLYVLLVVLGLIPAPTAESNTTVAEIADLNGKSVEITHTDSDLLAKDEYYSVYISDSTAQRHFWNFQRKGSLIFRYDPASLNAPLPEIRVSGPNQLTISIHAVSSVLVKENSWKQTLIKYDIGHVDYPGTLK